MREHVLQFLGRHRFGIVSTMAACVVASVAWPLGERAWFAAFIGAILVTAWRRGASSAFVATVFAAACLAVLYRAIPSTVEPAGPGEYFGRLAVFVLVGLVSSQLAQECRQAVSAVDSVHATLSATTQALIFVDARGRVTSLNSAAQALTGFDGADASGRSLDEVFKLGEPDGEEAVRGVFTMLLEGKTSWPAASGISIVSRTGQHIPIEATAAALRFPEGGLAGFVLAFRDISTDRNREAELELRCKTLEAMLEAQPGGVMLLDQQGKCLYANPASLSLLAASSGQLAKEGWTRFVSQADYQRIHSSWQLALKAGEAFAAEFNCATAQAIEGRRQIHLNPLPAETGRPVRYLATIENMSTIRGTELERGRSRELLRQLINTLPAFAAVFDRERGCIAMSRKLESLLRLEPDAWIGRSQDELAELWSPAAFESPLTSLDGRTPQLTDTDWLLPDGGKVSVAACRFDLPLEDGTAQSAVLFGLDNENVVRSRNSRQDAYAEAEDVLREHINSRKELDAERARLEKELEAGTLSRRALENEMQVQIAALKQAMQQQSEDLEFKLLEAEESLREAREQLPRAVESECRALREANDGLRLELEELQGMLSSARMECSQTDAAVENLQNDMRVLTQDRDRSRQRIGELEFAKVELEKQLLEQGERHASASARLEAELAGAKQETDRARAEGDARAMELVRQCETGERLREEIEAMLDSCRAELRQAQAACEALNAQLRQSTSLQQHWYGLVEHAGVAISAFDRALQFTAWNRAMEALTGINRSQALQRSVAEVFADVPESESVNCYREILAGAQAAMTAEYVDPKNANRRIRQRFIPLKTQAQEVVGGLVLAEAIEPQVTSRRQTPRGRKPNEAPDWLSFN